MLNEQNWTEFYEALRRFIRKRVSKQEDVEDILQDVLLKVHQRLPSIEHSDRMSAWLFTVARNTVIDYYRSKGKSPAELPMIHSSEEALSEDEREAIKSWLRPMLLTLDEKYRMPLELVEFEGLTQKEAAESLGLSLSATKSRVQRAKQQLRENLLACCRFELDRRGRVIDYAQRADCCENE